jgi:sialate O-acetylesterase
MKNAFLASLLCLPLSALADLKLPAIFSDNMVLQQKLANPVWARRMTKAGGP